MKLTEEEKKERKRIGNKKYCASHAEEARARTKAWHAAYKDDPGKVEYVRMCNILKKHVITLKDDPERLSTAFMLSLIKDIEHK